MLGRQFSQLDGLVFHLGGDFYRQTISNSTRQSILRTKILNKNITTEINAGANKNYMSIGVSVRTTNFAARNNGIGVRQESNPQSATTYISVR